MYNSSIVKENVRQSTIVEDLLRYVISLFAYLVLRIRQILFYLWALFIYLKRQIGILKDEIVKRMFWGRSSFYKSAFQFSVLSITLLLAIGGLTGRLDLFIPQISSVLAYPTEQISESDYLNERGSIQSIVASASLTRDFSIQTYIVQKGDTLASIADKFGVSSDTIRWENGLSGDYIKVGQELRILPINGVIYEVKKGDSLASIAKTYQASEQDIVDINWLESTSVNIGQKLLIPDGKKPQPKPIVQTVAASTPTYVAPTGGVVGSGSFIRPCSCGRLTNYFSNWHGGVDIGSVGGSGCTIVAADKGVVTRARWSGAGGLQIEINHGNGFSTLYAHNSAIYVSEGQTVERGQPIGFMGATGRATGIHLHFGVNRNGVWVNPLSYVPI